ncbi:hypothetical protein YC2023_113171 [Brassica napus]
MANGDEWRLRLSSVCLFRIEYNIIFVSSAMERLHQHLKDISKRYVAQKIEKNYIKKLAQIVGNEDEAKKSIFPYRQGFSGVFPLSKGPAAFEEGVYVYEMEQKIDEIDWVFKINEATVVPGAFRGSYTIVYSSFSNYPNSNPTLARRVYCCPDHSS